MIKRVKAILVKSRVTTSTKCNEQGVSGTVNLRDRPRTASASGAISQGLAVALAASSLAEDAKSADCKKRAVNKLSLSLNFMSTYSRCSGGIHYTYHERTDNLAISTTGSIPRSLEQEGSVELSKNRTPGTNSTCHWPGNFDASSSACLRQLCQL